MSKKIAFVVIALVALVATFCVSFAGMPLAEPVVPDIGNSTGNLVVPESWVGGTLYLDLNIAQSYVDAVWGEQLHFAFLFMSSSITIEAYSNVEGWVSLQTNFLGFEVSSNSDDPDNIVVALEVVLPDYTIESISEGIYRFSLPDDVNFSVFAGEYDATAEVIALGYVPVFGYFMSFESAPLPLGETVINNIIDTLWGTVVSVGDSFGEGMNQMVGDLFFDLETGDLSAFSIVIICFFALCLLVTIVNWLFFRLTKIRKF